MRTIGIDPGTGSFDFFGMDGDEIIIDISVPVPEVAKNPNILIDKVRSVWPLDIIVGPSGYGLPPTPIKDISDYELTLMVPDDKSIPLYDGIRQVLRLMQAQNFPVHFTPGAIHLPTIPPYRKANKLDMGTADKVCCVALAIREQAELYNIEYRQTSFILAEVGYAFNSVIAVAGGQIVDGLGGTAGGPSFLSLGNMDSELAIRLGNFPGTVLFSGGVKDMSKDENLTPDTLVTEQAKYPAAWNMLLESTLKGIAAMMVAVPQPREILLSGRLTRIPGLATALTERLNHLGITVRRVGRKARTAKEAAEGAYIIGEGLLGGKYKGIVDCLKLKEARGTMYDYIIIKGAEPKKP